VQVATVQHQNAVIVYGVIALVQRLLDASVAAGTNVANHHRLLQAPINSVEDGSNARNTSRKI